MTVKIGSTIPNITLKGLVKGEIQSLETGTVLAHKKVVMFAVPGAFTGVCSKDHLPTYVNQYDALKAKGVDEIICLAVNDIAVLQAWAQTNAATKLTFLADGNAELTKLLGLDIDLSPLGMGTRSLRYVMVLENGVVQRLEIEDSPGVCTVTAADSLLKTL